MDDKKTDIGTHEVLSDSLTTIPNAKPMSSNRFIAVACACFALSMVGAAYASVPLYELFCQVTGYGGTTQRIAANTSDIHERKINIRFDANLGSSDLTEFRPLVRQITLNLGETRTIMYEASNEGTDDIWASANFNVTPELAGIYFNKIECFCFEQQQIKPGEQIKMPVTFFIDPDLAADKDLAHVNTITLSYTFFSPERIEEKLAAAKQPRKEGSL